MNGSPLDCVREAWGKHLTTQFSEPPQVGEKRDRTSASARRICARQMALDLIHPEDREDFDADSMERMIRGRERDRAVSVRLTNIGEMSRPPFDVNLRQRKFLIHDRNNSDGTKGPVIIAGMVDGVMQFDEPLESRGQKLFSVPFEIKSGMAAARVTKESDLPQSRWTKHFIDQTLMYIYAMNQQGHEVPMGALVLEQPGLPLIIDVWLEDHLDRVESFLSDARAAVDVRYGRASLPPYINDIDECWACNHFRKSCSPDVDYGPGVAVVTDPEIIELLDIRGASHEASKTYNKIHEKVKKMFARVTHVIAGDWEITGKVNKAGQTRLKFQRLAEPEVEEEDDAKE